MTLIEFAFALAWVQFINDKKRSKETKEVFIDLLVFNKHFYKHWSLQLTSDGHYFGNKSWFSCCGQCIGGLIHFIFGPIDHFRDPQGRNKVDYFARLFFPFMLMVFITIYCIATLSYWSPKWRW